MGLNLHRLAEERSLALHRLVAERARVDPQILCKARQRVSEWLVTGAVARTRAESWARLLALPNDEIFARIDVSSEAARALRKSTPFAGVIDPRTRWRVWREVRARIEQEHDEEFG